MYDDISIPIAELFYKTHKGVTAMRELTICMYGGAREGVDSIYKENVESFGRKLAEHGYSLIFGGGATGLMGACARGARSAGGKIIGVFPKFMSDFEPQFSELSTVIKTDNMAQRKGVMENNADVFVICPGGVGTMDEFFQILTLNELKRHSGEIILFNINSFFDPMLKSIAIARDQGFIRQDIMDFLIIREDVEGVIEAIDRIAEEE